MEDKSLLKTVCEDIYTLTGIKPVIYDVNMRVIYAHPLSMGEFCRQIRCDPALTRKCLDCDNAGFHQCKSSGQVCVYRCHMGLTEAAVPILDQGTVIGYILFGQLLEEGNRRAVAEKLHGGNFQNKALLMQLLDAMQATDTETIHASARLISMCASYIQLRQVIRQQHKELALGIAAYIRQNLGGELTIPHLCRRFGISRGMLYTLSKNAFGMGITDYIRSCRMDAALDLLLTTSTPVCQVAESVGILDANYFTKLIKQRTGCTPTQLRRQNN